MLFYKNKLNLRLYIFIIMFLLSSFMVSRSPTYGLQTCELSATPNSGTAPLTLNLETSGTPSTGLSNPSWDFGDGDTTLLAMPITTYTYENPGIYNPVYSFTDADGELWQCSTTVVVEEKTIDLEAALNADIIEGSIPLEVTFNVTTTGGIEPYIYKYDFNDGSSIEESDSSTITHIYEKEGTYNPVVTVYDNELYETQASIEIIVKPKNLNAQINADITEGALPLEVNFNVTTTGGTEPYTYKYDFNDGSSIEESDSNSISHTYSNEGIYNPVVTVYDSELYETQSSIEITVNSKPECFLTAEPESGKAPLTVELSAIDSGIPTTGLTNISWDMGNGEIVDAVKLPMITYTYKTPGTYTPVFSFTDVDGIKWECSTTIVVEKGADKLNAVFSTNVTRGQAPLEVSFTPEITGGIEPYTYSWHFGDGNSSDIETPSNIYQNAGTYLARLIVVDQAENEAIAKQEIKVFEIIDLRIRPLTIKLTQPGDTLTPLVQGYYSDGIWRPITDISLESSDNEIVYISESSIVAGTKEGTAQVTAYYGDLKAVMNVIVNFQATSIDVEPNLKFLTTEESYTPFVIANYTDGSRREVTNFTLSIIKGSESIVSVQGAEITGISSGIAHLNVNFNNISTQIHVNVTKPIPLNIRPTMAKGKQDDIIQISVNGGKAPYTVSFGTIERDTWKIIVPSETGTKEYTLYDSLGNSVTFTLIIPEPLKLNRIGTGSTHPGDTIQLKPSGGTPPYNWSVSAGKLWLSEDSETTITSTSDIETIVNYTAPSVVGIYTVTITDNSGQAAEYLVSTSLVLAVTPQKLFLEPKEIKTIQVFGGVPPYTAVAQAGQIVQNDSSFIYTAPSVVGTYTITVQDSQQDTKEITVQVSHPLWVSPEVAYLDRNEKKSFTLSGGVGTDEDIVLQARRGEIPVNPTDSSFEYTAPNETGPDTILITDIDGNQIKVEIEVTSDFFFVTPSNESLLRDEERTFRVVGGTGDEFTWTVDGEGDVDNEKKQTTVYTAPSRLTTASLNVSDIESNQASASIHVISDYVLITPQQVYLKPGESTTFKALLGTEEGYEFTFTNGSITSVEGHPEEIIYTAPQEVGEYFITVFDSAGNTAQAQVIVSGGTVKPSTTQTLVHSFNLPSQWPDSENQPIAFGDIQEGDSKIVIAADFPNYENSDGTPIAMNYYFALYIKSSETFLFFGEGGNFYTIDDIHPFMTNMTDAVYQTVLEAEGCSDAGNVPADTYYLYGLAIESVYDINKNLIFEPADAPFEFWEVALEFQGCPSE